MAESQRFVRLARGSVRAVCIQPHVSIVIAGESAFNVLRAIAPFCPYFRSFWALLRNASFLCVGPQCAITRWRRSVWPAYPFSMGVLEKLNFSASGHGVPSSDGVALFGVYD